MSKIKDYLNGYDTLGRMELPTFLPVTYFIEHDSADEDKPMIKG